MSILRSLSSLTWDSWFLRRIFINFILEKSLSTEATLKGNIFNNYNKKNRFGYSCLIELSVENDYQNNFAENIELSFFKFVTAVLPSIPGDWTAAIFELIK